ncbi:MAG: retroviral-like aspartic protease family protein [Chloroflexota bacterium]|nr:retroviral-like aspartic protease family protein [Chloroflexota bacterium]
MPGRIQFRRLRLEPFELDWLIDTGSAISVVHSQQARLLGIDYARDSEGARVEVNAGVGGVARHHREMCWLEFAHDDGAIARYTFPVRVALPGDDDNPLPAILGMDFISNFHLTVAKREDRLELDPSF